MKKVFFPLFMLPFFFAPQSSQFVGDTIIIPSDSCHYDFTYRVVGDSILLNNTPDVTGNASIQWSANGSIFSSGNDPVYVASGLEKLTICMLIVDEKCKPNQIFYICEGDENQKLADQVQDLEKDIEEYKLELERKYLSIEDKERMIAEKDALLTSKQKKIDQLLDSNQLLKEKVADQQKKIEQLEYYLRKCQTKSDSLNREK